MTRAARQPDPLSQGSRVRITAGAYSGKTGTIRTAIRCKPAGADKVYVELAEGPLGWSIAVPSEYLVLDEASS